MVSLAEVKEYTGEAQFGPLFRFHQRLIIKQKHVKIIEITYTQPMSVIDDFLSHYAREVDFYTESARLVSQVLEQRLRTSGIRAIVSFRSKRQDRLEPKLHKRNKDSKYKDVSSIYDDIVDLAGVRVALYFPSDRDEVGKIIRGLFELKGDPKDFPGLSPHSVPTYKKRFSGYWATHYRVSLQGLSEDQRRYENAVVEVQVASVLMHAWSEVEHDLVYKPLQGALSEDEYAILDELNGLVQAGEIALERLHRAMQVRTERGDSVLNNHYELSSLLMDSVPSLAESTSSKIGDVEILFTILKHLGLDTPEKISPYTKGLLLDSKNYSLSEQIIENVASEHKDIYKDYVKLFSQVRDAFSSSSSGSAYKSVADFIDVWIDIESEIRNVARVNGVSESQELSSIIDELYSKSIITRDVHKVISSIGKLRTSILFNAKGVILSNIPGVTEELREALTALKAIENS